MLRLDVAIDAQIFTETAAEAKHSANADELADALSRLAASHAEFGPRGRDIAADPSAFFPLERMREPLFWTEQERLRDYLESHLDQSVRDVLPFLPPVGDERPVPVTVYPVPGLNTCYGSGHGGQVFGLMDGADPREMTLFCSHTYLHEVAGHINTTRSERAEADLTVPGALVHMLLSMIRNEGLANVAVLDQLEPLIAEGIRLPYFDYAHMLGDEKAIGFAMIACRKLLGQIGASTAGSLIAKVTAAFKNPKLPIINLVGTHLAKVIRDQLGHQVLIDMADREPQEFFAYYKACTDPLVIELFDADGAFDQIIAAAPAQFDLAIAGRGDRRAAAGGLIDLSLGAPVYPQVVDVAAALNDARVNRYAPMGGLPQLRSAVADQLNRARGVDADPSDVVITAGGSGALFASLLCLARPGEAVAVPEPGFPLYRLAAASQRLKVLPYRLAPSDGGFEPDFVELAAVARQARVLLWNFPSNPLGTVADRDWIERLFRLMAEVPGLQVVCDDVYADIVFDGQHIAAASLVPSELAPRLWSLYSFSKSDGLAGWRVGYLHAPGGRAREVARAGWGMTMSVPTASQLVALAALATPDADRRERLGLLRANRDLAVSALREAGLPTLTPAGGLFCWPDISATGLTPEEFVDRAEAECGVLVSAGTEFGAAATGRVRLSFAAEGALLRTALGRLGEWAAGSTGSRAGRRRT
jgi:aspartate/methionine/tyrosine aminotransferase